MLPSGQWACRSSGGRWYGSVGSGGGLWLEREGFPPVSGHPRPHRELSEQVTGFPVLVDERIARLQAWGGWVERPRWPAQEPEAARAFVCRPAGFDPFCIGGNAIWKFSPWGGTRRLSRSPRRLPLFFLRPAPLVGGGRMRSSDLAERLSSPRSGGDARLWSPRLRGVADGKIEFQRGSPGS